MSFSFFFSFSFLSFFLFFFFFFFFFKDVGHGCPRSLVISLARQGPFVCAGGRLQNEKRNEILTHRLGEVHCVRSGAGLKKEKKGGFGRSRRLSEVWGLEEEGGWGWK